MDNTCSEHGDLCKQIGELHGTVSALIPSIAATNIKLDKVADSLTNFQQQQMKIDAKQDKKYLLLYVKIAGGIVAISSLTAALNSVVSNFL